VVKRLFPLFISLAAGLYADSLADAARALAARIASHIEPNETAHVTARNVSSLPAEDAAKAQAAVAAALRKRSRNPVVVEVTLTVSESVKGFLVVAQVHDAVETAEFQPDAAAGGPPLIPITRKLLLEQNDPILDVSEQGDKMFVLSTGEIAVAYPGGKRDVAAIAAPPVRDPRGRLVIGDTGLQAFLPGATCRGPAQPLQLSCDASAGEFLHEGVPVHFNPGRNTLSPAVRDDAVTMCPGKMLVADGDDSVVLVNGEAHLSEPVDLGGPITALWPSAGGALAVARNSKTKQYAAYSLSVDCGH
jgi:hypothetical protein